MKFEVIRCLLRRQEVGLQNHQNLDLEGPLKTVRTCSHSIQLSYLFLEIILSSYSNLQGHRFRAWQGVLWFGLVLTAFLKVFLHIESKPISP